MYRRDIVWIQREKIWSGGTEMATQTERAEAARAAFSLLGSVSNILTVWAQATAQEREAGAIWYQTARDECVLLAAKYQLALRVVIEAVAALSPQLRWSKNIAAAESVIRRHLYSEVNSIPAYKKSVDKALAILNGKTLEETMKTDSYKTLSFAECIDNPDTLRHVCVDGHAVNLWTGRRVSLEDAPNVQAWRYAIVVAEYVKAAELVGVTPTALQATTWLTWRRLNNIRD